jgi:hypothetical protein
MFGVSIGCPRCGRCSSTEYISPKNATESYVIGRMSFLGLYSDKNEDLEIAALSDVLGGRDVIAKRGPL